MTPAGPALRAVAAAVLAAVLAMAVAACGSAAPRADPPAKPFSLHALGHPGAKVALAGYAGRPVIINFFASWCAPCQRETPLLARFYRSSRGRVAIIGVDANDKAGPAKRFAVRSGVTYPVGFDPFPAPVTLAYGVGALPQTFFLNARHRIVKRVFGPVTLRELTQGASQIGAKR